MFFQLNAAEAHVSLAFHLPWLIFLCHLGTSRITAPPPQIFKFEI